jgi:hypothetical protein
MLAVLSVQFTDQPQRWLVPALFMGLAVYSCWWGSSAHRVLDWGVASRVPGVGDLDGRPRPSTAS